MLSADLQRVAAWPEQILRARGLTRSFARGLARRGGGALALDGVDLDVSSGDIVGVIGREGAGKTTLLQCLAGLLRRDAGTVEWFGNIFPGGGCLPGLAYVPAMPVYYPFLTARDVLQYRNARETTGRAQSHLVDAALEQLGLAEHGGAKVMSMSRDEIRRLAIAEALCFDPRVVLDDTSHADIVSPCSDAVLTALRNHAGKGAAVVIAARDAHTIVGVASRIVILDEGRLVRSFCDDGSAERRTFPLPPAGRRLVAERVH